MTINKKQEGSKLTIVLEGRLDTTTAPRLDSELSSSLGGVKELHLDLAELAYLSSAGLRTILSAQKKMNRQGKMEVHNVCETIMEVFELTGFADILTIR